MEALALEKPASVPALSPAQSELLEVMGKANMDERSAAKEVSTDIGDLRRQVTTLARILKLPQRSTPTDEFAQLAREAARLATAQAAAAKHIRGKLRLNGVSDKAITQWQTLLDRVAAAVAGGVLVSVDPYKIRPMFGQPRDYFPEEEQYSLEQSFGVVGQIQDIIIRKKAPPKSNAVASSNVESEDRVWRMGDSEYEICDGERRWRSAMAKKHMQIRAKLIDIDDEGAYLVAGISNFNRVGHTTLEKARNLQRLVEGESAFPLEIAATMQGISVQTASKLLDALKLPPDILDLMDPKKQLHRGEEVLGKMPTYAIARLAGKTELHDHARHLAKRYVQREIKMPELTMEVDRILSRQKGSSGLLGERQQPARRLKFAESRISVALESLQDAKIRLDDLREGGVLPEIADAVVKRQLRDIAIVCEAIFKTVSKTLETPK